MKNLTLSFKLFLTLFIFLNIYSGQVLAQDDETLGITNEEKPRPVKNTFEGMWIIDNQTVMTPIKYCHNNN